MIKRNVVIFVILTACVLGIYWFSTPSEHDRWLAALGLSKEAAARVAEELAQRKRQAEAAEEAARTRAALSAAGVDSQSSVGSSHACEKYREQARQVSDSGQPLDDRLAANLTHHCDYR